MTTFRQIEANRRNARLSTGPKTEDGKRRSRRNAVRHGLTAETVIDALENSEDYAAFELAVTSDYEARTAVERELVLRLASLLWRLRRVTTIESGLFGIQARQSFQFNKDPRHASPDHKAFDNNVYRFAVTAEAGEEDHDWSSSDLTNSHAPEDDFAAQNDKLTLSFVRLANLPTFPLDRLSRYEATLWRQACQLLITLRYLDRRAL